MNSLLDKNSRRLLLKSANRQTFKPTLIKHRQFDCHIATAKQCGTHWIKYLLSLVLCEIYDLPLPEHVIEDNVVGHTKTPPRYDHIPQIAVTHSHPHYLLRLPKTIDVLNLPKFLVMVRDPRDILVSAFEKIRGDELRKAINIDHDISFSDFLRVDMNVKKPLADPWKIILFMNSWSPILKTHPNNTTFVRYEDMKADTQTQIKLICDFIGIEGVNEKVIQNAIEGSSRSKMREKLNPNEVNADKSVNLKARNFKEWYSDDDRQFINDVFNRHLKDDYGYYLKDWNS